MEGERTLGLTVRHGVNAIPCGGRRFEQIIFCSLSNTCGEASGFETGSGRCTAFFSCAEIAKWAWDVRATLE